MLLDNILVLANKHLFFSPVLSKNLKNIVCYRLGPSGSLFQDNIKSEWIYSNVTSRDASIFLYTKNYCENAESDHIYLNAREICSKQLPFGVAKIFIQTLPDRDAGQITENSYFSSLTTTQLCSEMFVSPSEGMQFFFHWQRQRKLWWKKISAFPGRFILGEVCKSPTNTFVNILANFSWGNQVLETISISPMEVNPEVDLSVRYGRKSVLPMVIKSEMSLESAVVGLFSDALDEDSIHKTPVLRIHRKLTPYKCIFAGASSDPSTANELGQLAFYLTKQFRKSGISTVCLPDCIKSSLSRQFQRNDEWGIPFTIVLDDNSLKSGIVNIRNRDTTLKEAIHVTDLSLYVIQLFNNF